MLNDWLHCPMSYAVYKFQPEIGEFSACCDARGYKFDMETFTQLGSDYFEKHPRLIERKKVLFKNHRHPDCVQCWKKEDAGLTSMRQDLGPRFNTLANNHHLGFDSAYPGRIELWMNSTCNLGCFMCHLGNSNTLRKIWHDDKDTHGNDGPDYATFLTDSEYGKNNMHQPFIDAMLAFTTKHINEAKIYHLTIAYLGGEPTLHNEMYGHADMFIEAGRQAIKDGKQLTIEFTTNGTSKDKLNERFYKMFAKYKSAGWRVSMMLSQDGAGEYAQVRHGADFEQIKRNFSNWIHPDSDVDQVNSFTVVSGLNLPYIDHMAHYLDDAIRSNYANSKHLSIQFNTLLDPEWMQVKYVPKEFTVEPMKIANEIYSALDSENTNLRYNKSLLNNIANSVKETIALEDAQFFFNKLNYVNSVYKKTYPNWDFFETFPHLNIYAEQYGIK